MTQLFIYENTPGKDILFSSAKENVSVHFVDCLFDPENYSLSNTSRLGIVYDSVARYIPFGRTTFHTNDYTFVYFKQELINFLTQAKTQLSLDLITCELNSKIFINEVEKLKNIIPNVEINYSLNKTGGSNNSDWILESNGSSVKDVYFTSEINNYDFSLGSASTSAGFIMDDGTLLTVGNNSNGQLGQGSIFPFETVPAVVTTVVGSKYVTFGGLHAGIVLSTGDLYMMGDGTNGKLGNGLNTSSNIPLLVSTGVMYASAGGDHTAYIQQSDGTVWTFGSNLSGQLGITSVEAAYPTPQQVTTPSITNITHVSCGTNHTAVVKNDGSVYTWGLNSDGQLGDGTTSTRIWPVQMIDVDDNPIANAKYVACGEGHTIVVRNDGSVLAVGRNDLGQLGQGNTTPLLKAVLVPGITTALYPACGASHTLILLSDGTVVGFGDGSNGELGTGSPISNSTTPVTMSTGGINVVAIAGGYKSSFYITDQGKIYGVGQGSDWQLANGDTSDQVSPGQFLVPPPYNTMSVVTIYDAITVFATCIHEDNIVKTSRGLLPIKNVISGDTVYDETGNPITVTYNIKMGRKVKKLIKIKKASIDGVIPTNDLFLTDWHPIKHDGKEISTDELLVFEGSERVVLDVPVTVYCICTEQRLFIDIEGVPVCTREEKSWDEFTKDPAVAWSKQ
jgi:alpha-tubulin suppressor-like RCC1 family protein